MIGLNIRLRRKKLKLSQQELANNDWTRSYISQIESGRIQPSIGTLTRIAEKLDITVCDLIGDQLLMDKAKATVFYPDICKHYLAQLPKTTTTTFLYQLINSLLTNKSLECQLPPNPELYYLTARVLIFQNNYPQASQVITEGIKFSDQYWRILLLTKLCYVYQQLGKTQELIQTIDQLKGILDPIDTIEEFKQKLVYELHHERDPIRCHSLINFLQSFEFNHELNQAFTYIKTNENRVGVNN